MQFAHHIVARTLVWLAAATLPLQGLPVTSCSCTSVTACSVTAEQSHGCCCSGKNPANCPCTGAKVCRCGKASPCQRQDHRNCCTRGARCHCCLGECCSPARGGPCPCGANCQCGKNNGPTAPAVPPVEHSSPERIVAATAAAVTFVTVQQASTTRQHSETRAGTDALSALDRCVTLCRFTI